MFRRVVPSSSSAQNGDMHRRVTSSSPLISDDYIPRTVEHIFINYRLRRVGLLRAFGTGYKEDLSLYGYPDGTWDVQEACMVLPPNLPEPAVGINLARDRMRAIDWVTLVAEHCDSWLLSLAFFFSVGLSRDDRGSLFERINDLPTLAEKVKEYYPGQLNQSRIQQANLEN
uniref:PHD finger protein ALFIN-LIKE n=1 Tax=Brassica oleracea var. oleracea TaxID=109376 RepID=A0A0D3AZV9_BRAOL